jgi:uroporphyrin-III C-methyltransferase/precorrin-2 dehydrogenase/sirohydrochlorin ferrochelatase
MQFLPVFLNLRSGTVALVGSGAAAMSKMRLLTSAGASVRWYALTHAAAGALAAAERSSRVEFVGSDPLQADFGEFIAVVAAGGGPLDAQVAQRARERNIPVNVVDRPDLSSFIFPAIVDRGEVVVAIGTAGASPVLARRLRERIETVLPARIGDLAALMGRFRAQFARSRHASRSLREFWESVVDGPIGAAALAGRCKEAEAALVRAIRSTRAPQAKSGAIFLVGAGPGDPDLLTLRALQALQGADLVFYDQRITSAILDRARREAKRIAGGKAGGDRSVNQNEIAAHLLAAARDGLNVVWLTGGAGVFGNEALDYLARARARVTLIPGVAGYIEGTLPANAAYETTRKPRPGRGGFQTRPGSADETPEMSSGSSTRRAGLFVM